MREPAPVGPADAQGDFYAAVPPAEHSQRPVIHRLSCAREPCDCFGLATEVRDRHDGLELRLLDAGEAVSTATLAGDGTLLVMARAAVLRASTTGDWLQHYPVVSEVLLREAVRVADDRGADLAVPVGWPVRLLAELGFAPHGKMLRRVPAAAVGHGLLRTPQTRSGGQYAAWCLCGEQRRAEKLGDAHEAVFRHIEDVRRWLAGPGPQNITLAPDAAGVEEAS